MARRTYAQLQKELEALKAEESRQALEKQVKVLRAKVRPSKIHKVGHGLVRVGHGIGTGSLIVGSTIIAGLRAFDNGLKWLEEEADM
jgi:hypothetical protein